MKERHYSHGHASRGRSRATTVVRRRLLRGALAVALAVLAGGGRVVADTLLRGRVVHIGGADRFTLATEAGGRVRVRLAGTLSPAGGTPAASAARRELARLLFGREVQVRADTAHNEPLSARVLRGDLDIGMQMVAQGWLGADGSDAVLLTLETQARDARRGQWATPAK